MPAVKICDGSLLPAAHAVLIRPNSSPGSRTGGYVAGTSAAYENQNMRTITKYAYLWGIQCSLQELSFVLQACASSYETVVFRDRRKCIKYNFRAESTR